MLHGSSTSRLYLNFIPFHLDWIYFCHTIGKSYPCLFTNLLLLFLHWIVVFWNLSKRTKERERENDAFMRWYTDSRLIFSIHIGLSDPLCQCVCMCVQTLIIIVIRYFAFGITVKCIRFVCFGFFYLNISPNDGSVESERSNGICSENTREWITNRTIAFLHHFFSFFSSSIIGNGSIWMIQNETHEF